MRRTDGGVVGAVHGDSSLTRIRRHEREAARKLADAHRAAERRVAESTAEASTLAERARDRGLREADRRYDAALAELDQELAARRVTGLERAARIQSRAASEAAAIASRLLAIVLPASQPGSRS